MIKTRNGQFPLGTLVLAVSGWRSHYLSKDGKDLRSIQFDLDSLSPSVALGVLGMPGYELKATIFIEIRFVFLV